MTPDRELLSQYAEQGDEAAFAEVVRRHTDLVYSAALRVVADGPLAQDVTQTVFTKLAQQAPVVGRHPTPIGWLHTTARHTAINAIRAEARRHLREHEAFIMQKISSAPDAKWEQLRPILDEAVGQLRERDRQAVLLRFFNGLSHREVGAVLGLTENSAQKCVDRALEKLRTYFARRGVTVSSALLAVAMSENSVQAAPTGLAANVAGTSLAGAGVATESIFLKLLLMSTKAKLFLALAVIITVVTVTLTLKWSLSPPPSVALNTGSSPTKMTANQLPAPSKQAIIKMPVVAAAQPGAAAPATTAASNPATTATSFAQPSEQAKAAYGQIAKAYAAYSQSSAEGRVLLAVYGDTAHAAALELASKVFLNDASVYFEAGDPLGPKTLPKTVMIGDPQNDEINPAFANATLSVVIAANMPVTAPVTTTPFVWTRGLQEDGTWAPNSPYGGKGGYIAFLDGHVEWFEKLSLKASEPGVVTYSTDDSEKPTLNINDALPLGTMVLPAAPAP